MKTPIHCSLRRLLAGLGLSTVLAASVNASTYTVTTSASSGPGSFLEAYTSANVAGQSHTIVFDASTFNSATRSRAQRTITLAAGLPLFVGSGLTINGDVNGDAIPDVILDGAVAYTGISTVNACAVALQSTEWQNFRSNHGTNAVVVRLAAAGSSLTITDSIFHDNANTAAALGGGALSVLQNGNALSIDRSIFYSNSHGLNGGAIYCVAGTATIANSVFYDNQAGGSSSANGGGAVRFQNTAGGTMNIYNCTFVGNRVPNGSATGGGVCASSSVGSTINIHDSILVENTGPGGAVSDTGLPGAGALNMSNVTTGSGTGLFVNLGSGAARDLRLSSGSSAVNAGGTTSSSPNATYDVLNNPRKIGSNFDRGAYEYNSARTLDADSNNSSGASGNNYSASAAATQNVTVNVADSDVAIGTLGDDANVRGVTFTLSGILNGASESLLLTGSNPNINAVAYDSGTSRLTLYSKPAASVSDMQTAIRNVVLSNSAANPTTGARTVTLTIADASDSAAATATLTLASANSSPTVNANTGLTLNEGGLGSISASALDFNDAEQADSAITYTVTSLPANGDLLKSGAALVLNGTFTQTDIANGSIRFAHDGTDTGSDSFGFTVSDGAGGSVSGQIFNFTITPVNDANVLGATPTITFSSAPGSSFALDGQGGSSDVAGITLEVCFANAVLSRINNLITFEDPYSVGSANSGLAINYSGSQGSHYVILKSRNSADNFWLQSLQLTDYGGNNINIEAFDNGVSQGSVNVTVNADPWYFTFDNNGALTPAIFRNADEIRIKGQDSGVIWLTINDVKLAAPVNNNAPTDIALSNSQVSQSSGVNAAVGTLSTTDANGTDTHTYSLVSGAGSTDNASFNISGATLRANNAAGLSAGSYSVRIQTDDGNGGTFAEAFSITVVDDIAPAAPASFTANASGSNVSLSWVNPADADFATTTIRRSTVSFPATVGDGTLVAQGLIGTSQADNGLADGTYYYAIFALDGSGNVSSAATASVTIDTIAPTLSIGAPSVSITNNGSVTYTVTFSGQDSITLGSGDITINSTGSAAAGTVGVSGSGNTRTVTLSNLSGDGTLGISIASGTASDTAGNLASADGPSTTFTVDNTAPLVSIGSPSTSVTAAGSVSFTVTWSDANLNESSIDLAANQVTLNGTGSASGDVSISGSGTSRTVTISNISGSGTLGISVGSGTATDTAGNAAPSAGPSTTFTVNAAPSVAADTVTLTVGEGSVASNTGTFSDVEGNATATVSVSAGSVVPDNNAGTWSWTLNTTDGPEDSQTITITVEDGLSTNTASFTLTVTNLAPVAVAQNIVTPEDVATNITLTATDPGLDSITNWVVTVNPANGTLSGTAPNLIYTPGTNFSGSDSFKFSATDSDGATSAEAVVSIDVTPVNDAPLAGADGIARPNTTRTAKVAKSALLANDTDPEGASLSITAVGNATPSGATVAMAGAFVVFSVPSTNAGDGSFTYVVSDGSRTATNTVFVTEIASVPASSGPNYAAITPSGSDFTLTFIGVPGRMYRVQYTTSASAPYTWNEFNPLAVYTAPTNGVFTHIDINPPDPMRLYRAVSHP